MTEFAQYNRKDCRSLEEIWNNLLRLHWDYLDTEENLQKLEMRKNLEGELKDFLCVVQHDRKFFLTETPQVLKQSIMKMDNFTAYKALIGFETISHYANNLFRKPWRKEYRCIKVSIETHLLLIQINFLTRSYRRTAAITNTKWRRTWSMRRSCLRRWGT